MAENETMPAIDDTPVIEVTPTAPVTDEPLGEAGKAALQKERAAARAAEKRVTEYEAKLKEYEDRDKSEAQKILEERDALKAERDSLHFEKLRREVAEEKGLTPAQSRRLNGTTREELEADADDVLTTFPIAPVPAKPVFGDIGQGARGESGKPTYSASRDLTRFDFYEANKADILLAQREGRITD